jgi:predicted ATP-grasp superfamily ATP-dependent carboligase
MTQSKSNHMQAKGYLEMNKLTPRAVIVSNQTYDLNALGAIRSLGKKGVKTIWVTPSRTRLYYSKYCKPVICPDFRTEENSFVQFLLRLGKKRKLPKDVLIPTSDASLGLF